MFHSNWHIHSEASYDATLPLSQIVARAKEFGFKGIGITDHLNFNDEKFIGDLKSSAAAVKEIQKAHPFVTLGVELTPIEKPEFDYIAKTGTREGYIPPIYTAPYDIELGMTKEELKSLGVRYAIGAAHWRVDVPFAKTLDSSLDELIREWYRQQMWLAQDERVTILGHPWYNGKGAWYDDFSHIPRSMNMDIAAALKENGKYVECNSSVMTNPKMTEKYRYQYAEFLRELFEMGIPVTYGSDSHKELNPTFREIEKYLVAAGFRDGDFSELDEAHLW